MNSIVVRTLFAALLVAPSAFAQDPATPAAEAPDDGSGDGDGDASEPTTAASQPDAATSQPASAATQPDTDVREAPAPVEEAPSILPPPTSPRLLVMDLVDNGAGTEVTAAINQTLATQALKSHEGEVVTTAQIRLALDAASQAALVGCDGQECMTDVAKLVEAERVIGGSVAKVGDDFLITVLVVSARDGSRLAQEQRKVPGLKDMYFYATQQLTAKALTGRIDDPSVPVRIESTVEGSEVAIDGAPAGVTPLIVKLVPGEHEITVRASGHAVWRTVTNIEEASPVSLSANLVAEALPLWPATVVAGAVAVVGYVGFAVAGIAAQDAFDGSYSGNPEDSYLFAAPIDNIDLDIKQREIEGLTLTANALLITGIVATAAAAAITVTDIIINAE